MSVIVQRDATYTVLLYFCRQLYMFRMIPLSIIRSTLKTVIITNGTVRTVFATVRCVKEAELVPVPNPPRQRTVANTVRTVSVVIIIFLSVLLMMD